MRLSTLLSVHSRLGGALIVSTTRRDVGFDGLRCFVYLAFAKARHLHPFVSAHARLRSSYRTSVCAKPIELQWSEDWRTKAKFWQILTTSFPKIDLASLSSGSYTTRTSHDPCPAQ